MKNKENNFVSAVLYIHNNEQCIKPFLEKLNSVLTDNFKKYEIVCVNDSSNDNSTEEIEIAAKNAGGNVVFLINTGLYQGLESAMLAGVDFASGDFVFEFDSVYSDYDMSFIMEVYNRCISGYDIVGASSNKKLRKSSSLFYYLFNKYSKAQYKIQTESFRILSRRAINRINQMSVAIPYRKAIYANCGLKKDLIEYTPTNGIADKIGHQFKDTQDTALTTLILFTDIVYKITFALTIIMMLATLGAVVFVITIYLIGIPFAGYTTIMLFLSGAFFAIFAVLTVVIKYLSVILSLVFNKRQYMVESIEKIN